VGGGRERGDEGARKKAARGPKGATSGQGARNELRERLLQPVQEREEVPA
jgi:hypothetical protein